MNFNHLPLEEFEEPCSDLENVIELEITIFESFPEMLSAPEELTDHYIFQDDYLQKELERQEQEGHNNIFQQKVP